MTTHEYLIWSIEGRARSQRASLRLLTLIRDRREVAEGFALEVDDMVASAFSLWRAVFLADMTDKMSAKIDHAESFLTKLLTDNAISFAQDRSSREWTFDYYIDNAFYRLDALQKRGWSVKTITPQYTASPEQRWDYFQTALEATIDFFDSAVVISKNSN